MADEPWPSVKRVLMTADAVGGVWQYTATLTRLLVESGVRVLVATIGPQPSSAQRAELPLAVELAVSNYELEWADTQCSDVDAAGEWLLQLGRDFGPDVVHLNGYCHASLPWEAPVIVVAHSCVSSWWHSVWGTDAPPAFDEYRRRVRAGLQNCDRVVAPSKFMAAELSCLYRIPAGAIDVIYNCCADKLAAVSEPKQMFCLAAGRFGDTAKNSGLLQEAAKLTKMPIHLAGEERYGLGRLSHSDLMTWMGRAHVFAHPAVYEPFGLAVLEAARAHCCLLLADTASARELWEGAAIFLEPHSPACWAEALQQLSEDCDLCQRWGALAFERSMVYSESAFAMGYQNIYSGVLKRHCAPA